MNETIKPQPGQSTALSAPSKASFKKLADCRSLGEAFQTAELKSLVADAAPKFMDAGAMLRTWVQAANKQPLIYQAELRQVLGAFQSLAYLGLVPNTHLNHAHMIPFKTKRYNPQTKKRDIDAVDLQIIIGYAGYIELGYRADAILPPHCDVVYDERLEGFHYSYGSNSHLEHGGKPYDFRPSGDPRYAYAYVKLKGGGEQFEVMPWVDVMRIRDRSQAYRTALAAKEKAEQEGWRIPVTWTEAPWVRDQAEMGKKTPLRRLFKILPKCPELRAAAALEDAIDSGKRLDFGPVIDGTASPLEGGVPEAQEDDPPAAVDPATAYGVRGSAPPMEDKRAVSTRKAEPPTDEHGSWIEEQERDERAAQTRSPAAPKVASGPAQQNPKTEPPRQQTAAPGFEAVLIDAGGEASDAVYDSPAAFARAYMALWHVADQAEDASAIDALAEYNADALADAAQGSEDAQRILAATQAHKPADEPVKQNVRPPIVAVEPPEDRGKTSWPGYIKLLKATLAEVTAEEFGAWAAAQRAALERCPTAQRVLAVRAIAETAGMRKVEQPLWLGDLIKAKEKPPASAPPPAEPPAEPVTDADEKWVNNRIGEMHEITTRDAFDQLVGSGAVRTIMARLRREKRALFDRADAAFSAKHQALPPPEAV
jgi:recombination protein RecT